MNFYQIFLPIATVLYFLLVFVLRSWILWKQTGINPFVFGQSEKAHDYIGFTYKFVVLATWISIATYSFFEAQYDYLMPIQYLDIALLKIAGIVLMILSFAWTAVAQYQMSVSWRIGINYEEQTDLVVNGLFKWSRNPVFFGVLLSYLATFLVIPNILSFTTLMVIYVTIQIQVRMEEEYLLNVHGKDYEDYCQNVHRWI